MAYVKRDENGTLIAISHRAEPGFEIDNQVDEIELRLFLAQEIGSSNLNPIDQLVETDGGIARVTEDLIQLLISKNLILFTDLPIEVQRKLIERDKLREGLIDSDDMDEGDTI
jgi:hypothetical protein